MVTDVAEKAYTQFGISQSDVVDVRQQVEEENDLVEWDARELKYTRHLQEFKNLCSTLNKDKSSD